MGQDKLTDRKIKLENAKDFGADFRTFTKQFSNI
jgi:hypothetical protein